MKLIKPNAQPTTLAGFSRASTATYIDDAGVLQTAGVDVPRFQGGLMLVEDGTTNLLPAPEAFDSATWVKQATTVTPGLLDPAPNGLQYVADAVFETADTAQHDIYATGASAPGQSFSVFLKPVGRRYIGLYGFSGGIVCGQTFDLVGGVVGSPWAAGGPVSAIIQAFAGGWWRIGITSAVLMDIGAVIFCESNVSGVPVYPGNPAAGAYLWGAMMNTGDLSSYTPATRAADIITGSGLLSTTATDATPAYSAGTTYLAGVQVQYNRVRYQSLQASNTGRTPDVNPTWWARLGPVNQWAMFDDQVSTQTVQATGPLRVALQTGAMDALAVLGVEADRVRLVVQDGAGGPVVYDQTQGMAADAVTSWFDYFFNDPTYRRTQALFQGIAPFGSSVATLTFSGSAVKVGHVSYGRVRSLGGLRYGARAGIKDFSRKDTDEFGVTTFVRRANSKYLTGTLEVEKTAINQVHNLLTSLTATPVVWIGSDDVYYSDTLLVYGFYRDFYASIDYPTLSIYSLEIEGLT